MNLYWTKKKPTKEGWYWCDYEGDKQIYKVQKGEFYLDGELFVYFRYPAPRKIKEFPMSCRWCGPIPLPTDSPRERLLKKENPTFKDVDEKFGYHFRKERIGLAKYYRFDYISECTAKLYERHRSSNIVADLLGITQTAVLNELRVMKKLGLVKKIRSKGGANHRSKKENEDNGEN